MRSTSILRRLVPQVISGLALLGAGTASALAATASFTPIGPDGGTVTALAAGGAGTVYAGTADAGIFKSTDGGASWHPARLGLPKLQGPITLLYAAPRRPGLLYAATALTVVRSEDGGASWVPTAIREQVPSPLLSGVAVAPSNPNVLYVAAHVGIYRSADRGVNWKNVTGNLPLARPNLLAVDPREPDRVYWSVGGSVYQTRNGGASWTGPSVVPGGPTQLTALAVDPRQPATLYAGTYDGRIFRSRDRGDRWIDITPPPSDATVNALVVERSSGTLYAGVGSGLFVGDVAGQVFRSRDGGRSWSQLLTTRAVQALAIDPSDPKHLYAGTVVLGVVQSRDGGNSWAVASRGLQASVVTSVAVDAVHPLRLYAAAESAGGPHGLLVSSDGGVSWAAALLPGATTGLTARSPRVSKVVADPRTANSAFAIADGGVVGTRDGGATWASLGAGFAIGAGSGDAVPLTALDLVPSPTAPGVLYALGSGTFDPCEGPIGPCPETDYYTLRSDDRGEHWATPLGVLPAGPPVQNRFVLLSLALSRTDPGRLYAAGRDLVTSSDGGATWRELPLPIAAGETLLRLVVDPFAADGLYAGIGADPGFGVQPSNVLVSQDGGASWTARTSGLPAGFDLRELAAGPATGSTPVALHAATDRGLFRSDDLGAHWVAEDDGLTDLRIRTVAVDPRHPDTLYAGTDGDGGLFVRRE